MIHDIFYIRTVFQEAINLIKEVYNDSKAFKSEIFKELKSNGVVIVRDFYTLHQCQQLIDELEGILSKTDKYHIIKDQHNSDNRAFAVDLISDRIAEFLNDEFITTELSNYLGTRILNKFTMANKVNFVPDNLGSGGGWHRDSPHKRQVKSILYLTNVEDDNGPFEYLMGTHKPLDTLYKRISKNLTFNQNRFESDFISGLINKDQGKNKICTGKAGTLILVDTRGIHRGRPIMKGVRFALTNYIFDGSISPHMFNTFVTAKQ
jgi:hypothetical protein